MTHVTEPHCDETVTFRVSHAKRDLRRGAREATPLERGCHLLPSRLHPWLEAPAPSNEAVVATLASTIEETLHFAEEEVAVEVAAEPPQRLSHNETKTATSLQNASSK